MGLAGVGTKLLFWTEMLSFFVGGAIVLVTQLVLVVKASASIDLKTGAVVGLLYFMLAPVFGLIALGCIIAFAYLFRKITPNRQRV